MVSRRKFVEGLGALAAMGIRPGRIYAAPAGSADFGTLRLSVGVMSDIHVASPEELPLIAKAWRYYDSRKADAILCCGDIADYGLAQQLKLAGNLWQKVFPNGKGSDGREVVNLLHYGDHDMSASYADLPTAKKQWPDDAQRRAGIIFNGDRGAIWKDAFGASEPWEPIVLKTVKGYPFVLSHFTRGEPTNKDGNNVPGLAEFMRKHAGEFDPKKPIFYSQHRIPKNTTGGKEIYGQDDGTVGKIMSQYPNAFVFCGHCHMNASTDRSIWQGAFTCVQVPGHRYSTSEAGVENGYAPADRWRTDWVQTMRSCPNNSARQMLFMRVYDTALVIERLEYSGRTVYHLGDDWVVPLESFKLPAEQRPFNPDVRVKTLARPVFPAGAKVTVGCGKDWDRTNKQCEFFRVKFPAAPKCEGHPRGHAYAVVLQTRKDGKEEKTLTRYVYPGLFYYGDLSDKDNVHANFRRSEVEDGLEHRFVVAPLNGLGKAGKPIASDWMKLTYIPKTKA